LISIQEGNNRVVGQTYKVESATTRWAESGANSLLVHIELVGEIQERETGETVFSSGIANYPRIGAVAHRIRTIDLAAIYQNESEDTIKVGHLTQDKSIEAKIDLEKLISRHFAVVGSTGVGKSTSVSLILRKIIERRSDLRVVILDPHNEFTAAFPEQSVVKDSRTLSLPFWLFNFDEFAEVVFRGQKGLEVEGELLRDFVAEAKERHDDERDNVARLKKLRSNNGYTADSPVPYRLDDLFKVIDERLGQLDGKHEKPAIKALRDRLAAIVRDPRFGFMFGQAMTGGDRMTQVLADIFRVPHNGRQISIVDMSALPAEVMNSVVSVISRLVYDLAVSSQGAVQTLLVCEEAHRYVPADHDAGFFPVRQAIARIAKEGRKYGAYLGVVTQRPSEIDPSILSQCNTVFAMRLANQADQKIIGGAMTNGAQTSVNFLSSIANRECIAFGEALKTPMRMTFESIGQAQLPGSHIHEVRKAVRNGMAIDLTAIVRRMRETDQTAASDGDEIDVLAPAPGVVQRENRDGLPPELAQREIRPRVAIDAPPLEQAIRVQPPTSRPPSGATAAPMPRALQRSETANTPLPGPASRDQDRNASVKSLIHSFRSRS
jgi:DNA helicase HerA-like ATPase